jgi:DNA gyrase/topoisomerase IV subunit B
MCLFVNCLIENPSFDSQTKETMTLRASHFGSTYQVSPKFIKEGKIVMLEELNQLWPTPVCPSFL